MWYNYVIDNSFQYRQIWRSDWENSRCGLSVLPFANYINPNVSTLDNFNYCVKKKTDPMIRAYTKYKLDKAAAKAKLENERAQKELEKTKEIVDTTVEETKSRFSGLYEMYDRMVRIMEYSSHSIQNFFYKIGAIIWTIYYLLISSINSVSIQIAQFQRTIAVVNALSILAVGILWPLFPISVLLAALVVQIQVSQEAAKKRAYCCFTPGSLIDMKYDESIPIKDISLGDELYGNGIVTGVISLMTPGVRVLRTGMNTYVTGDHLFKAGDGVWKSIDDTHYTLDTHVSNVLMCLVTSNNTIHSGNLYIS